MYDGAINIRGCKKRGWKSFGEVEVSGKRGRWPENLDFCASFVVFSMLVVYHEEEGSWGTRFDIIPG